LRWNLEDESLLGEKRKPGVSFCHAMIPSPNSSLRREFNGQWMTELVEDWDRDRDMHTDRWRWHVAWKQGKAIWQMATEARRRQQKEEKRQRYPPLVQASMGAGREQENKKDTGKE
jgi:hypothetical protein